MSDKQDTIDEADKEQLLVDLATSRGERRRAIAVDFDGTVVTHDYPAIGRDISAVPVLHKLVAAGNDLILLTIRDGQALREAVDWFSGNQIPLWAVNDNPDQHNWNTSRKVYANLYIDDAAAGSLLTMDITLSARPFIDWAEMNVWLHNNGWYAPLRTSRASTSRSSRRVTAFKPGDAVQLTKEYGGGDNAPIGCVVSVDGLHRYTVIFSTKDLGAQPLHCDGWQLQRSQGCHAPALQPDGLKDGWAPFQNGVFNQSPVIPKGFNGMTEVRRAKMEGKIPGVPENQGSG